MWAINNGFEEGLTIDRIDANLGYNPLNCRWVTKEENTREMVERNKKNKTGIFSNKSKQKRISISKEKYGRKFMMFNNNIELKFNCLKDAADYIIKEKELTTHYSQIKKNISACLNNKRKTCHGYKFKEI